MEGLGLFRESKKTAEDVGIENVTVKILSFDDLILVNRLIDQSDLEQLGRSRRQGG